MSAIAPLERGPRLLSGARAYFELTKPRVVSLIVFTAVAGMFLATPHWVPLEIFVFATLGISLAAGSAAAFNHILDQRSDAIMARTRARPLPTQRLPVYRAVIFATVLAALSMAILAIGVNLLTAVLTFMSLIGYSVIYTLLLKRSTPQNIVIGGAAGAAPPLLGWTAVTGNVSGGAILLFLIIFIWTPPHFWALALYRAREYATAGIPMLPVTHGSLVTRQHMLAYTLALFVVTLLPYAIGMSGLVYLAGAIALGARFVSYAWRLWRQYSDSLARRMFRFSIQYLAALFTLLLLDHFLLAFGAAA